MVAGLQARLRHEEALRFAFLLATPAIAGAGLLGVPQLVHADTTTPVAAGVGGAAAAVAAWLSVRFLTRHFQIGRLAPFAYYCLGAEFLSFALFAPLALGPFSAPVVGCNHHAGESPVARAQSDRPSCAWLTIGEQVAPACGRRARRSSPEIPTGGDQGGGVP